MGLISPHEYKYINDSLIKMRYGNYTENKYYKKLVDNLINNEIKSMTTD